MSKARKKPVMRMVGADGNAFAILGCWRAAAKRAGWTEEEMSKVVTDATSKDYNHLLMVISKNSTEPDEEEDE